MRHYDDCRLAEDATAATVRVTEKDRLKLLKHILWHGGEITLYTKVNHWEWPVVFVMKCENDNRIIYGPHVAGHKTATIKINSDIITDNEKTKILLS